MADDIDKFRFYIVDNDNHRRSSVWSIRSYKNSLYISPGTGGSLKLSIHPGGEDGKDSQIGLKNDYAETYILQGYNIPKPVRWTRPITATTGPTRIVSILFPTDYLRGAYDLPNNPKHKKHFALQIAGPKQAVEVGIFFSQQRPEVIEHTFLERLITPIVYGPLSSDEFITITACHIPFPDTAIPSFDKGSMTPLEGSPRPGEFVKGCGLLFPDQKDGEPITIAEICGLTVSNISPVKGEGK